MKVFQIGFSKCGTSSIHERLRALGLNSVHNLSGELAKVLHRNAARGDYILQDIDEYQGYTDMHFIDFEVEIEGYRYFRRLCDQVEDAMFILNTRNMDNWLKSCKKHPQLFQRLQAIHCTNEDGVVEILTQRWKIHHDQVANEIPREKLLIFDIETDKATKIDGFLGFDIGLPTELEKANVTPGVIFNSMNKLTPRWARRRAPKSVKKWLSRFAKELP